MPKQEKKGLQNLLINKKYSAIVVETPKAWKINLAKAAHSPDLWLPKSQCKLREKDLYIQIPLWLLKAKGIDTLDDAIQAKKDAAKAKDLSGGLTEEQ